MGKVLSLVIGLILLVLGTILVVSRWGDYVWPFIYGAIAVLLVLVGLGVLLFAITEMRAGPEEPVIAESPSVPSPPSSEKPQA